MRAPDGSVLSRRGYEDIVSRRAGFGSWRDWQKLGADPEYRRALNAAVREGRGPGVVLRARGSEFNRRYIGARRTGFGDTDASPSGPMGRWLIYLGRRRSSWTFAVGDTPPGMVPVR